jgi:hypothetical protein
MAVDGAGARARNLVEWFLSTVGARATRDDKLAASYLAFVELASIRALTPRKES